MNSTSLFLAVGGVEEDLLQRSETAARHPYLRRWAALAACVCLIVTLAFPTVRDILQRKYGDPSDPIAMLEFGGKFYEAVDDPAVLETYGLPREITADMAGAQLIYLEGDRDRGYRYTAHQTDKSLYLYAPAPGEAVFVLQDGESWLAAIFCYLYPFDSNTSSELTELYRIYHIGSGEDIVSVTEMDWHREKIIGTPLTDRQEIGEFYTMTAALPCYGNDDFQKLMFGGCSSEEEQQALHIAFAEDSRVLRVETAEGLRFYLNFYPTYRWISSGGTLSYYSADDAILHWFDRNFNER